jgi:hypothetical protein
MPVPSFSPLNSAALPLAAAGVIARTTAQSKPVQAKVNDPVRRKLEEDVLDLEATGVETDQAVRGSAGNGQEQARKDRQEHAFVRPDRRRDEPNKSARPRLDLRG